MTIDSYRSRTAPVHGLVLPYSPKILPIKTLGLNTGDSVTFFIIHLSYVLMLLYWKNFNHPIHHLKPCNCNLQENSWQVPLGQFDISLVTECILNESIFLAKILHLLHVYIRMCFLSPGDQTSSPIFPLGCSSIMAQWFWCLLQLLAPGTHDLERMRQGQRPEKATLRVLVFSVVSL